MRIPIRGTATVRFSACLATFPFAAALTAALAVALSLALAGPALADKHENWVEARSPNFIVVCDAGEKKARKTAVQFEQIRAVFREALPIASAHPSPVITILAVKDANSMRKLVPEDWVKGHAHHSGWFAFAMDQYYAAVELDASGDNPYETLYHEYYHSLTVPYVPYLPPWLAEGLAEFFGHTEVQGNEILMGEPDRNRLAQLSEVQMIPLGVLFKVDHNSPYYNEENKTSIFYSESWALTHYLFFHDRQTHTHSIDDYLSALGQGVPEEQAATKAFGDLKKLQATLGTYVSGGLLYSMRGPAPAKIADSDIQIRPLSQAEADAYSGGLMAARGRSGDAIPLLKTAIQEDPKLPLAYENLALAEFLAGDHDRATSAASQAIALGSKMPLAHYLRAYASYRGNLGAENPQVEADLRQAIAADPNFAPPYALLASYLANRGQKLDEALALAEKAASLQPGSTGSQLAVAQVLARMERYDDAQVIALRARQSAPNPQQQQEADRFLQYLGTLRTYSQQRAARQAATASFGGRVSESSGDARSSQSAPPPVTLARRPGQVDLSGLAQAQGTVTASECGDGELRIQVAGKRGNVELHGPRRGVTIMAQDEFPAGFDPCGMKGAKVQVWYAPDAAGSLSGTMRMIELLDAPKVRQ